jgi:hypothetical protein
VGDFHRRSETIVSDVSSDLATFHHFVGEQVAGGAELTPEECLHVWRVEHPTCDDLDESVAAVKRALAQADRGEGKCLDEFDRDFRVSRGVDSRR